MIHVEAIYHIRLDLRDNWFRYTGVYNNKYSSIN